MGFIITSQSDPVYDEWGWDDYWSANDWIRWHKALKTDFGLQKANEIFVDAYVNPPSSWELYHHMNYRSFDTDFKKYAKENKFYNALFTGTLGTLVGKTASITMSAANTALDSAGNVVDSAGNVVTNSSKGIENLSKLIKYGLPVLVIIALYLGYKFFLQTKFAKAL